MAETIHLHTTGLDVAALPNGAGLRLTDQAGNQAVIHGPDEQIVDTVIALNKTVMAMRNAAAQRKGRRSE